MPKARIVDFDQKAQAAAFLKSESGLSQDAIAKVLGVSQSAVSRLLNHARRLGCLRQVAQFVRTSDIGEERIAQLERLLEHSDLAETLSALPTRNGVRVRSVRIFDSGSTDTSTSSIDQRQMTFGRAAAVRGAERLRVANLIGVTWGSTVSALIESLATLGYPWPENAERRVVPVSAEPLRFATNEYTSSTLAARLHAVMNLGHRAPATRLYLTGVPALIPANLARVVPEADKFPRKTKEALPKILRRFFEGSSSAYRELFVGPKALIQDIDILITSVGTAEKPMGFCNDDLLKFSGLDRAELSRLVLGDVGGVLLPASGLSKAQSAKVAALNAMWTGIQHRHLDAIARRAEEMGTPGVVLIAIGASRSAVVFEALAQGLCSELVIDRDLATALSDEVSRRLGATSR
jgi:DNA-binding transcriptional regulator LsrR (DeoR family)